MIDANQKSASTRQPPLRQMETVMRKLLIAGLLGLAMASGAQAQDTTIRVHYAIPTIWSNAQTALAEAFMAKNPDIEIVLDGAAQGYEDGVQRLLRESVAGTAPDVAYVGLNLWRVLQARGLAQPLDEFIGDEAAFEAMGYTPALRSLGQFNDVQYASAPRPRRWWFTSNPDSRRAGWRFVWRIPHRFRRDHRTCRKNRTPCRRRSTASGPSVMTGASSRSSAPMAVVR